MDYSNFELGPGELEAIFEGLTDGLVLARPGGEVLQVNQAALCHLGFSSKAELVRLLNEDPQIIEIKDLSGAPLPMNRWPLARALAGEQYKDYRIRLKRPSTKEAWIGRFSSSLVKTSDGKLVLVALGIQDVTAEHLLATDLKVKGDVLEFSLNAVDIVDSQGRFIYANRTYLDMWGYSNLDELLESSPADHCLDPAIPLQIIAALKEKGECNIEFVAKRKDGSLFDVLMWARRAFDASGNEIYPTTSVDISDRKSRERLNQKAKVEAERASGLKSAFLANMSHEIRTPLGAMLGFADLLREDTLDPRERAEYLDILIRNGQQLSIILNDILDLSKVEAGHLTFETSLINTEDFLEELVALWAVKAKGKGLTIKTELTSSAPRTFTSDPVRIKQILFNLLGNAIKFTSSGGVEIICHSSVTDQGEQHIGFDVIDTGIGIPEAEIERIFEMFTQGDDSVTRRFGGTGLGLALSRRLARALGGEVSVVESHLGKGTTFRVSLLDQTTSNRLHYPKRQEFKASKALSPTLARNKILAVDDSPDNLALISRYLSKQGAQVHEATNGEEALNKVSHDQYDLILMDIQMPVMDGYTATRKLREQGFIAPIIAVTAHATEDVRLKCLEAGCTDHLTKPLKAEDLYRLIHAHLSGDLIKS